MKQYDLLVVGGGVLGAFHAYHALDMGLKVALIERSLAPQGASVRNFGQVVPSGFNSKWQRYGRHSLQIYKRIQAEFDISLRQNGSVYVASDPEEMTLLEELAQINRQHAYPSQLLSAAQCLERYPALRRDYALGGLFFPEEVTLEPRLAIHRILWYLIEKKGLEYFPDTPVVDVQAGASHAEAVASDGRRFRAGQLLLCSGSEFRALFPAVFAESDLVAVKIQMLETTPLPGLALPGSVLSGLSIRRYECFGECPSWAGIKRREPENSPEKRWGVHILFKQTTEGSLIVGDSHEYADAKNADELGFDLNHDINDFILQKAAAMLDLPEWRLARSWFGVYSQCKNSDIFRHSPDPRVHIVTGIGGKGMTGSAGFAAENIRNYFP
jgi:FAD dependent oxidoreductase TIGR03364